MLLGFGSLYDSSSFIDIHVSGVNEYNFPLSVLCEAKIWVEVDCSNINDVTKRLCCRQHSCILRDPFRNFGNHDFIECCQHLYENDQLKILLVFHSEKVMI